MFLWNVALPFSGTFFEEEFGMGIGRSADFPLRKLKVECPELRCRKARRSEACLRDCVFGIVECGFM